MGIKYAHKLTHSIEELSFGNIETIIRSRYLRNLKNVGTNSRLQQPTIDVDVSWLYRSKRNIKEERRISSMMDFLLEFTRIGISVVLVCDGDTRHHSKKASIERRAKLYSNTIEGYITRNKLMSVTKEKLNANDAQEIARLTEQEKNLSTKIKNLEKYDKGTKMDVGQDFYLALCAYIDGIPLTDYGNQNGRIYVIKAEFQADSVISYRLVNKISDMALCNDSDLAMYAGKYCISIKSFTIVNKQIRQFAIFSGSTKIINSIKKLLHFDKTTVQKKLLCQIVLYLMVYNVNEPEH
jgi:hypothetical protein